MKESSLKFLAETVSRFPSLTRCLMPMRTAVDCMAETFRSGGHLLVCGNGGSASDSLHIVGELMKSFILSRCLNDDLQAKLRSVCPDNAEYFIRNLQEPLPAISLVSETALTTAYANDVAPDLCFAQQVLGYGRRGDVLLAISTSGNSANVVYAAQVARTLGMKVIGLTGQNGGRLSAWADILIDVPECETYKIQELHLPVYHALCLALEQEFFGEED